MIKIYELMRMGLTIPPKGTKLILKRSAKYAAAFAP